MKLAALNLESSEAYLMKQGKNLSDFRHFFVKIRFKNILISQPFLELQQNNNIFLKLKHFPSSVPNLKENRLNLFCQKSELKNTTNVPVNSSGLPY